MTVETAPFKKDGGLWHSVPRMDRYEDMPEDKKPSLEWRKIETWTDTMLVVGQQRGRSAAFFLLVGGDGRSTYPMFMTDAADMMKTAIVTKGTVTGRWTIVKRGQNYGVKFLGEEETE